MGAYKDDYIRIRLSAEDKKKIKEYTDKKHMSLSDYIMRLIVVDMAKDDENIGK